MELNVALIQTDLFWQDKVANLDLLTNHIQNIPDHADIILLPEMFSTGFTMEAAKLAETMEGPTLNWMREMAHFKNAVIAGSLIIRDGDHFFNRLIWMPPNGQVLSYDKKHLFTFAGEDKHYTAGKERMIIEWKGWKILPLVCYDLRFPVWSRNREDYDLLVYVASWPEKRAHAWKSLLVARAIENQSYTIGLNRVGRDGNDIYYSGDSRVIDYEGKLLFDEAHDPVVHLATLSMDAQQKFRQALQFLKDRDSFTIVD